MTEIVKHLIIRQLFHIENIQHLLKEFLFHTEETSPSKNKIRESKHIINNMFAHKEDFLVIYMYPLHLQMINPVTKWCIMISPKYIEKCRKPGGFLMAAYNCERCGNYYKDEVYQYTGKRMPERIECSCFRVTDLYSHRHFDMRE